MSTPLRWSSAPSGEFVSPLVAWEITPLVNFFHSGWLAIKHALRRLPHATFALLMTLHKWSQTYFRDRSWLQDSFFCFLGSRCGVIAEMENRIRGSAFCYLVDSRCCDITLLRVGAFLPLSGTHLPKESTSSDAYLVFMSFWTLC